MMTETQRLITVGPGVMNGCCASAHLLIIRAGCDVYREAVQEGFDSLSGSLSEESGIKHVDKLEENKDGEGGEGVSAWRSRR